MISGREVARVRRIYHLFLDPPYTSPPGGAKRATTPSLGRRFLTRINWPKKQVLLGVVNDFHNPQLQAWNRGHWLNCPCHEVESLSKNLP